jgi:hypothetical protein
MAASVISYGGGVQSSALVVLAASGELPMRTALFANVGDNSEHPATITYVRDVMTPWAAARGVEVVTLNRRKRDGSIETLFGRLTKPGSRSLPIPVRMPDTGAPGTRSCTTDFKIRVLAKWLKAHGATASAPATVAIGISWDEIERLGNRKLSGFETVVYPLIDRRLTREDCKRIIERAGLPVPPKSACYFCPFHRPSAWSAMRTHEPALFQQAVDVEALLLERRREIDRDPVYFTRFGKPLAEAIPEDKQIALDYGGPGAESCDEGVCWT